MKTEKIQLDREDIILLILQANERLIGKEWFSGITRLEKLVFLLEKESTFRGIGDFFQFEAHNFGPFSKEVYEAIEFLASCELIEVRDKAFPSLYSSSDEAKLLSEISDDAPDENSRDNQVTEKRFRLSDDGRKVADEIRKSLPASDIKELEGIVRRYGTRPLNLLIRYVYRQHPEMTVRSIHPEASNVRHASR